MSLVGSFTHWTFRYLISFLTKKIGIEMAPELEMWIAYILTGAILLWVGVWSHVWWWPFR
jgi:hypothetical protein